MRVVIRPEMMLTGSNKGGTRIWRKRGLDGTFKDTCCIRILQLPGLAERLQVKAKT